MALYDETTKGYEPVVSEAQRVSSVVTRLQQGFRQPACRLLGSLLLLILLLLAAMLWALTAGDFPVTMGEAIGALSGRNTGRDTGMAGEIVRTLRLPRMVAAFAGGGLLAMAGVLMQVLLRNPLADPYVLGISGGAAVGALGGMLLGLATVWVDLGAFIGALSVIFLVLGLARGDGSWTQARLLLTGVVVAAGCGALVTLMLALAPTARIHPMLFWLMGDVSGATHPWFALIVLGIGLMVTVPFARDLNVMARGMLAAAALGVPVNILRWGGYILAAMMTAVAVTLIGTVGFVGLIVPHFVRLLLGSDQRILLPVAALSGGLLLLVADTAARTLIAPVQLPVGVLTALMGVPAFLFLLTRHRG